MGDGSRSRDETWADFRARCDSILDGLPLDPAQPLTIDALCAAIERQNGRPLTLSPLPQDAGAEAGLCGLWISLGRADHIFYETTTSAFHQRHIILHEIAHLLLGHGTQPDGDGPLPGMEALFPDLDPATVRRLLARGRTDYTELQEQQAELMATLIHQRSTGCAARAAALAAQGSDVLDRWARTLGKVRHR
ncbi:ImmA/IrrE family metallo-endopeptidase [Streptomyces sp. enrichment culture]|uniref:ImmA/IrrE family metallo-endopeptidase n=1 Tax=Streptomyces sp. enrichment culture TaxID=1795815 RepID=UPI003F568B20